MFKLVPYEVRTVSEQAVGIRLKFFLFKPIFTLPVGGRKYGRVTGFSQKIKNKCYSSELRICPGKGASRDRTQTYVLLYQLQNLMKMS